MITIDWTRKYYRLPLWLWVLLILGVTAGGITYYMKRPAYASWRYGACKEYLTLYLRFPTTVHIKEGWETAGSAGMSFADTNPFGSEQIRSFECYYSTDAQGGVSLSRLTLDRKSLPEDVVARYNAMLPVLAGQKLDNALPRPLPDKLEDAQDQ